MKIVRGSQKLSRFLSLVEKQNVRINKSYQRSAKVWPLNAKSYLVETVIMNLVLPRLMLHVKPATRSSRAYTDIIDGQQRTAALRDFRKDQFRLSAVVDREDLRGKKYSTLHNRDRLAFDNYVLNLDRFVGANDQQIRDVFRRINSHTVPLNPEEQRHARFQGEFKWFIHRQMGAHTETLKASGALTEKQINRMADAKLLTDIVHAMLRGIMTTNSRMLRKLYEEFDNRFGPERQLSRRLIAAFKKLEGWGPLPKSLQKHYHAYSLVLAVLHGLESLNELRPLIKRHRAIQDDHVVRQNLDVLAEVLTRDEDDVPAQYSEFYLASSKGTNVRTARETRFVWFWQALTDPSI